MSSHHSHRVPETLDSDTLGFLCDASKLNEKELQELYNEFKMNHPAGQASEFMNFISKTQGTKQQLLKKAQQFFSLFDKNKDKSLSKEEVQEIINTVFLTARDRGVQLKKTPELVCDEFFSKLDADGNCEISEEEFIEGLISDPDLLIIIQNPEIMNDLKS